MAGVDRVLRAAVAAGVGRDDLRPVTRRLTHLPDDELRAVLRRTCLRLLP